MPFFCSNLFFKFFYRKLLLFPSNLISRFDVVITFFSFCFQSRENMSQLFLKIFDCNLASLFDLRVIGIINHFVQVTYVRLEIDFLIRKVETLEFSFFQSSFKAFIDHFIYLVRIILGRTIPL